MCGTKTANFATASFLSIQDNPRDILAGNEGINIGILRSTLEISLEEYSDGLKIDSAHPMVKFLEEMATTISPLNTQLICGLTNSLKLSASHALVRLANGESVHLKRQH